jgi:hypothetical protein
MNKTLVIAIKIIRLICDFRYSLSILTFKCILTRYINIFLIFIIHLICSLQMNGPSRYLGFSVSKIGKYIFWQFVIHYLRCFMDISTTNLFSYDVVIIEHPRFWEHSYVLSPSINWSIHNCCIEVSKTGEQNYDTNDEHTFALCFAKN